MPVEAADEVAGAGAERDAVAPGAVRRAGGPAAVVAAGVHGHHVVHGGVVVELCTQEKKAIISVCLQEITKAASCRLPAAGDEIVWLPLGTTHRGRRRHGSSCPWTSCPR